MKEFDINPSQTPIFVDARIVPETIRPHYLTCPIFFVLAKLVSYSVVLFTRKAYMVKPATSRKKTAERKHQSIKAEIDSACLRSCKKNPL